MTFYEWLILQAQRQDPIGDLAREVAKLGNAVPMLGGYTIWMQFLRDRRAGERWREYLEKAFGEFYEMVGT